MTLNELHPVDEELCQHCYGFTLRYKNPKTGEFIQDKDRYCVPQFYCNNGNCGYSLQFDPETFPEGASYTVNTEVGKDLYKIEKSRH